MLTGIEEAVALLLPQPELGNWGGVIVNPPRDRNRGGILVSLSIDLPGDRIWGGVVVSLGVDLPGDKNRDGIGVDPPGDRNWAPRDWTGTRSIEHWVKLILLYTTLNCDSGEVIGSDL